MEFTHQNLNQDFLSIHQAPPEPPNKGDHFKDFFSIVEYKFEKEKEKKTETHSEELNVFSGASKEVFASENKNEINKIELMNFFFDEDEDKEPPKVSTSPQISGSPKHSNLIDIGVENHTSIDAPKRESLPSPTKSKNQENLIPLDDEQSFKPDSNPQPPAPKASPAKDSNLIDLK
jgi:hypothetical protein